jgi:mannosyltransferase
MPAAAVRAELTPDLARRRGTPAVWDGLARWSTITSGSRPWVVLAVMLIAVLSWYQIDAKSLWYDEAYTLKWVYSPVDRLLAFIRDVEPFNGLYYLWAKAWSLVQVGETWLRVPSAILAVASVPVMYLLTSHLAGVQAGRAAALLTAVSPFLITMAQEARSYTLVIFLVASSTLLLVRAIEQPRWWRWLAYGVAAALAVWAHVWVAFVVLAHGLATLVAWLDPVQRRWMVQGVSGFVIAGILVLPVILLSLFGYALQPSWYLPISGEAVGRALVSLAGGSLAYAPLGILGALVVIAGAFVGAVMMWTRPVATGRWRWAVAVGGLVVPVVVGGLISVARPIFTARYLAVSLPFLLLLAAVAVASIPSRRWRTAALAGVMVLSLVGVAIRYEIPKQDWRGASDLIRSEAAATDLIAVFRNHGKTPLDVYLHGAAAPAPFEPTVQTIPDIDSFSSMDLAPDGDQRRIWLVVFPGGSGLTERSRNVLLSGLGPTHALGERHRFHDLEVLRFDPIDGRPAAGARPDEERHVS